MNCSLRSCACFVLLAVCASVVEPQERSTKTTRDSKHSITLEIAVEASPAEVFEMWSTSEGVKSFWVADARIELKDGVCYELFFEPGPNADASLYWMRGTTLRAFENAKSLSFGWSGPAGVPEEHRVFRNTWVELQFERDEQAPALTQVRLTHCGLDAEASGRARRAYVKLYWSNVRRQLRDRCAKSSKSEVGASSSQKPVVIEETEQQPTSRPRQEADGADRVRDGRGKYAPVDGIAPSVIEAMYARVPSWELSYQRDMDARRIRAVHRIASLVEDFHAVTGRYPLERNYGLILTSPEVDVHIRDAGDLRKWLKDNNGDVVQLEEELEEVFKHFQGLPRDPQRIDAWGGPRVYQYHFDGKHYYVSAYFFFPTEHTRLVCEYSFKYQVGSRDMPERKIRRFSAIPPQECDPSGIQTCAENLKEIGKAMHAYAVAHDGKFPGGFAKLARASKLERGLFSCPGAGRKRAGWYACYGYVRGQSVSSNPENVLVYERSDSHYGDGGNVLFVDGEVQFVEPYGKVKELVRQTRKRLLPKKK